MFFYDFTYFRYFPNFYIFLFIYRFIYLYIYSLIWIMSRGCKPVIRWLALTVDAYGGWRLRWRLRWRTRVGNSGAGEPALEM